MDFAETTEKSVSQWLDETFMGNNSLCELMLSRLERIRKLLQEEGSATLILGAGISCTAGLPGWNELLGKLLYLISSINYPRPNKAYGYGWNREFSGFSGAKNPYNADALEVAEYIYKILPLFDSSKSKSKILASVGENQDEYLKVLVKRALTPDGPDPFQYDKLRSKAIGRVAELAFQYFKTPTGANATSRRSVLTYNFDNLVEHCLEDSHQGIKVQPIFDKQEADPDSDLHIYHPHGYLDLTSPDGKESKKIILAESSYYDIENKNYKWENFLLARALYDKICLVFGFSGIDYNFKRIMKNLDEETDFKYFEQRCRRYMFVSISSMQNRLFPDSTANPEESAVKRMYDYLALKESYWMYKGFLPVWVTRESLPHIIQYLIDGRDVCPT